ncbi:MAG TPA: pilus assembly protein TadG-related protein [Candidatus Dormibacteraeota bacterium]|nr:pilus assembly protein TadG-related protein [Candidatus Dormibacteraeota bacterium]
MGRRGQQGQAIVLIALMLTIVTGMAAIAIDGARAYAMRRDMQAAVDAASLAAGDKLQQTGSYVSAEQAATASFGANLRLYAAPTCGAYGSPGASPWTVTCTFSDGTSLTEVARALGAQGSAFTISATSQLQLQFGRVLTNGAIPTVGASAVGDVGNLVYSPAVAGLRGSGCGGTSGSAITVNGTGTLTVTGDVVANGVISVTGGGLRVAGDTYSRCQSSVSGAVSACYPSGASAPCTYPDAAGSTQPGFHLADPGYPAPAVGGGATIASSNVIVLPGVYASPPILIGGGCWFFTAGVYDFQSGAVNLGDFVSNELKPPDEPDPSSNTIRSANQFWNTNGVHCAGAAQASVVPGTHALALGNYAFEVTSVRTDTYAGVSYQRESAPSMCYPVSVTSPGSNVQIAISNVPGATSYNIYASPPSAGGTCAGPFGLAANLAVTVTVQNNNLAGCPAVTGAGCSLGNQSIKLDQTVLGSPFAPSSTAAPGVTGSYPPDDETAPMMAGLPNQNAGRGNGVTGDRANENECRLTSGAATTCPAAITPGAVELYFPNGACLGTSNSSDTYLFSGYQYDWISAFEPTGNTCFNVIGASGNSAFIGLFYAPDASMSVTSAYVEEGPGTGGLMLGAITFSGTLPTITFRAGYAPVPPASRLTG